MTLRDPRPLAAVAVAFLLALGGLLLAHRGRPGGSAASTAAAQRAALAAAPTVPPGASTDERIRALQADVRALPRRADGWVLLAAAYQQKVRETGDPAFYTRADGALRRALALAPADPGALTGRAVLELSRHDFRTGLADARRAHRHAPTVVAPYGPMVDGLVELGRYREAGHVLQEMVDRRPDLASYARVSYFRELHGDLPGALAAMRLAVSAGGDAPENAAYVQTLLGNLELLVGRVGAARHAFEEARARLPGYAPAEAGLAKVDAAGGHLPAAIRRLREVVARLPLPEHVIALGETELAAGRRTAARRDLALVGVEQRLLAANGVNTDTELALFQADHGSAALGVDLARRAWSRAPSVRSADALGWALTRAGRPWAGMRWARRALALGARDPLFLYHAGMAARAAGDRTGARRWLGAALAVNPRFSPLYAPRARRALRSLS